MFFIISEPIYGIIYENSKKEKRVMGHKEIRKLCDATLKRVLEGLKSYNNDVKHRTVEALLSDETLGDVCECKTNKIMKGTPIIIDL
ncbi:hypothetical protein Tco_0917276 [Tanacetum coccineum]